MDILSRDRLYAVSPGDPGVRALVKGHYSVKRGGRSWWSPAKSLCLTNIDRTIAFLWQHPKPEYRRDHQDGYNNSLFRNVDGRLSSDIILEAERSVVEAWGPGRAYTYIDPKEVKSSNPGYCYKKAGWRYVKTSDSGKHLLEKYLEVQDGRSS